MGAIIKTLFAISIILLSFTKHAEAGDKKDNFFYKEVVINAPIEKVDQVVHDYENYRRYFHHMTVSNVIRKHNNNSSTCQIEFNVLGRTFWALVRMDRVVVNPSLIVYKETTIDTNLKELSGEWNLIKINEKQTKLIMKGIIKPKMPLPRSFLLDLLNKEVSGAIKRISRLLEQ